MKTTRFVKTAVCLIAAAALLSAQASADSGQKPYDSYNYSLLDEGQLPSPASYLPDRVYRGMQIAGAGLKNPRDLYLDEQSGMLLLADTGNSRIIITDAEFADPIAVSSFTGEAGEDSFREPEGVCFADDGLIYVADTGNKRLVCLKPDGSFDHIIPEPHSVILGEGFDYKPQKVAVSSLGNIYVVCAGVYQGILELSQTGEFLGFTGMNRVTPSLWDRFWRAVSTDRQKDAMVSFIPVSFSNLCLDADDFILATTQPDESSGSSTFKRLNPSGQDVRRNTASVRATGDLGNIWQGKIIGQSVFVDVASLPGGVSVCLDSRRCRLFLYDSDGYLMTVFGFSGWQNGLLSSPCAVDSFGLDLYVLDSPQNSITVYRPTEYGESLLRATELYHNGNYTDATALYEKIYRLNFNSELAYTGIGKAQLREGRFKDAMTSFRLANNKALYSRAFAEYRKELFSQYFIWIFAAVLFGLAAAVAAAVMRRRKAAVAVEYGPAALRPTRIGRYFASFDYAFYYMLHPFKGANDLKREKRGTVAGAVTWTALYMLTVTESGLMSGYLFRSGSAETSSVLVALASLLPIGLWCVANWCLTTLTDGEGSFKDIFISASYSLAPFVMVQIPLIAVSNLLTLEEAGFYHFFYALSLIWTAALLIIGNMTIHNVSMKRALATVFLTVVGMVIILVLGFLVVNLCYMVFEFFRTIYREMIYRI